MVREGAMKLGTTSLQLTREIPLPILTMEHRIRYAIGCALSCQQSKEFIYWATRWVDGTDRSAAEAAEAEGAAWAAAEAAAWAAAAAGDLLRIAEWAVTIRPIPKWLAKERIT